MHVFLYLLGFGLPFTALLFEDTLSSGYIWKSWHVDCNCGVILKRWHIFSHVAHITLIDMVIECDLDAQILRYFANKIIAPEEKHEQMIK